MFPNTGGRWNMVNNLFTRYDSGQTLVNTIVGHQHTIIGQQTIGHMLPFHSKTWHQAATPF